MLAIGIPAATIAGLLIWGMVQSGGRPGGVIVNNSFGEVRVDVQPARYFSIETFDGVTITSDELLGKVVMLDFWASWCPPCRREAPVLAEVYKEYAGRPVEFIGVDVWDDEGDARAYIRRYGITYPNGLDPNGTITIDYGVAGIPEKFFIDREGILRKKLIGPMNAESLRSILDELLTE